MSEIDPGQLKSLKRVGQMVDVNGATWLYSLADVVAFFNGVFDECVKNG